MHNLQIEYDNKKAVGFVDERQADRDLALQLKTYQNDNMAETEYKRLSVELEQLHTHLDQLKQRKKTINLITD